MYTIERWTDDPTRENSEFVGELGRFTGPATAKREALNISLFGGYFAVKDMESGEQLAGYVNGKQVQ